MWETLNQESVYLLVLTGKRNWLKLKASCMSYLLYRPPTCPEILENF